jgi:hypothetical protein
MFRLHSDSLKYILMQSTLPSFDRVEIAIFKLKLHHINFRMVNPLLFHRFVVIV